MRRVVLAMSVVVVLFAVGGCGADQNPTVAGTGTTSTSLPVLSTTSTTVAYSTTEVSAPPQQRGLLTAVRTAPHDEGFLRVTFEFRDAAPGYRVGFTKRPVVEDGSGREVTVAGSDVLLAHFEPASGVDLQGEKAVQTYTGSRRIAVDGGVVREVVRVGDFEANLTWAIGVEGSRPFRVFVLDGPPRVVIDVSTQ